jgi:hypothetical protein
MLKRMSKRKMEEKSGLGTEFQVFFQLQVVGTTYVVKWEEVLGKTLQ